MRRRTTLGLIFILLAALIGAGLFGLARFATTSEGTRLLLTLISRYTPVTISAQKIDGRLLDHLHLEKVRLTLAPFEAEIETIDWHWQPLHLLSGTLAIRELTMTNVRIRDNARADVPPDLTWPKVSGIAALFDARIERLHVKGLSYQLRDGEPSPVTALSCAVLWRHALLSLSGLDVAIPAGRLTGTVAAGFALPSLQVELAVFPAKVVEGMDTFSLTGRFRPGINPEQFMGRFTVYGSSAKTRRLELEGEAGMTRQAFHLRKLRLTQPGRRGVITGNGSVTPTIDEPFLAFQLTATGIDFAPELKMPTDLSGTVTFAGTPAAYGGEFKGANEGKGWQRADLSGSYRGDPKGVRISPFHLSVLSGSVRGNLVLGWDKALSLQGEIRGERLDPAGIDPDWTGFVNFTLAGGATWPDGEPLRGDLNGILLESRLHGQALTGNVRATVSGDDLRIGSLTLRGKGFALQAAGNLRERLAFSAVIDDLGGLIPQTAGKLRGEGWVRRSDGKTEWAVTGSGTDLAAAGWKAANATLNARFGESGDAPLNVSATLRKAAYERILVDSATLKADGSVTGHTILLDLQTQEVRAQLTLTGNYDRGNWQGKIARFSGRDAAGPWNLAAPAALAFSSSRITLAPLSLTGGPQERFELSGTLNLDPIEGSARATWNGLNPARAKPWLPGELQLDGAISGQAEGKTLPGERLAVEGRLSIARSRLHWHREGVQLDTSLRTAEVSWDWQGIFHNPAMQTVAPDPAPLPTEKLMVTGQIDASGSLILDGKRIAIEEGSLRLAGNERGLTARIGLALAGGGTLKGEFSSPLAAALALPAEGTLDLNWAGIDVALLRPWLPNAVTLEGSLSGRGTGHLLSGKRISLKGDASLTGGKIRRLNPEGEINANLRSASLTWDWQQEALSGTFTVALVERGEARGSFQLPLPARLPVALDHQGPLRASLTGQVHEKGLLSSLFPGLIRESRGELDADLRIGGTWDDPTFSGTATLAQSGAYLPTAGIQVRDVQLTLRLEKDLLSIDSFRASSGPGHIEGKAQARLKGWRVADYRGSLGGDRFQIVYLPELQILATPRLTFEGTPEKLAVRGEVQLPELFIFGPPARTALQPSSDVIIEGAPKPAEKTFPLALDIQVRLILGDKVFAKLEGIDAQLGGGIDLLFQNLDKITSRGEIKVVKGRYKAYGVDLEIIRGRLFYTGGPINQPTLDILALRTIGDVKAGITAGGLLRAPVIKLYSEPAMPDVDILAYIVFGHPMSNSSNMEQAGMLAQAASVLLSKGKSAVLQEQIKNRLGLSTLEIQSGSPNAAGRMGYKEIAATPTGIPASSQSANVSETILTVGKYLTPKLYFSYGRSLFTGGNLFRLRYDLFKQWQIETQTGTESGVDLYYRIDFN